MIPAPLPILRDLPDELVVKRILIRPLRPGDGAAIFEAVEESREPISPWLPWVEKTRSSAVPMRPGFTQEALWQNKVRNGVGDLRNTLIFALAPDDYTQARVLWQNGGN